MNLSHRIALLAELGHYLKTGGDADLERAIRQSYLENQWFTEESTQNALTALANTMLDRDQLTDWARQYELSDRDNQSKTIGVVMAGNIPAVGFHDWLCVFTAGFRAKVKLSDKDKRLLPLLVSKIGEWDKTAWSYTEFTGENEPLTGFDAVIATGSNNTARYFEQYFGKYPHIIRRNRHAVGVLTGQESMEDLYALGRDIFTYFGLGCRNVSKLYVPHGYQFDMLLEALHEYRELAMHNKYKNNFDYNMTLFLLNNMPFLNNGCVLLREDTSLHSRIASVHYEYYGDLYELEKTLTEIRDDIQCVVAKTRLNHFSTLPFGKSQEPGLSDYADGVDVMAFLKGL